MKKLFYYTTASLVISCGVAQAQTCVPTPDCQTLGYTSSSYCSGGLKCPFGNYWNCDAVNCELSGKVTELTEKIAELETLLQSSEGGTNNKTYDCLIGDIFYSDWTCSTNVVSGKTPIAVVVYMDGAGHGQALALKSIGSYQWETTGEYVDISTLQNFSSASAASQDYDSCVNTKKIMDAGGSSTYGAAYAANYYMTTGTEMGDWCLPAAGIFTSYYNNQDAVNAGFDKVGGTKFTTSTYAWSSSEYDYYSAWNSTFNGSDGLGWTGKNGSLEVRPVIEF